MTSARAFFNKRSKNYLWIAALCFAAHALFVASASMAQDAPADESPAEDAPAAQVIPLFQGNDAFYARLSAIQNAQHTIDLQSYIFHFDSTGQVLARELMRKAKEGVKVRLSIDKNGLDPGERKFLEDLRRAGVDVRIYNPIPIVELHKTQYRNHQKMLVVDAGEPSSLAILGGRNIGDEYFSNGTEHNFFDTDVVVRGSVVGDLERNFSRFWEDGQLKQVELKQRKSGARWEIESVDARIPPISFGGTQTYPCNQPEYVWDEPAPDFDRKKGEDSFAVQHAGTRRVKPALHDFVRVCKDDLRIESAYFISNPDQVRLFEDFHERGGKLTLITNSHDATDVAVVTARFDQQRGRLERRTDADIYQLTGEFGPQIDDAGGSMAPSEATWGTHAKMMVCDDDAVAIGSANWDPRSLEYNAEDFLFCRESPELAARVRAEFERRKQGDQPCSETGDPSSRNHPLSVAETLLAPLVWIFSGLL